DGYRMHARIADGKAQLLTRTGLDWSKQYRFTIEALDRTRSLRFQNDPAHRLCHRSPAVAARRLARLIWRTAPQPATIAHLRHPLGAREMAAPHPPGAPGLFGRIGIHHNPGDLPPVRSFVIGVK